MKTKTIGINGASLRKFQHQIVSLRGGIQNIQANEAISYKEKLLRRLDLLYGSLARTRCWVLKLAPLTIGITVLLFWDMNEGMDL